jgi:hypothetical protein
MIGSPNIHVRWHLNVEGEVLGGRGGQAEERAWNVLGDSRCLESVSAVG